VGVVEGVAEKVVEEKVAETGEKMVAEAEEMEEEMVVEMVVETGEEMVEEMVAETGEEKVAETGEEAEDVERAEEDVERAEEDVEGVICGVGENRNIGHRHHHPCFFQHTVCRYRSLLNQRFSGAMLQGPIPPSSPCWSSQHASVWTATPCLWEGFRECLVFEMLN
jgi:hypothetical protein